MAVRHLPLAAYLCNQRGEEGLVGHSHRGSNLGGRPVLQDARLRGRESKGGRREREGEGIKISLSKAAVLPCVAAHEPEGREGRKKKQRTHQTTLSE